MLSCNPKRVGFAITCLSARENIYLEYPGIKYYVDRRFRWRDGMASLIVLNTLAFASTIPSRDRTKPAADSCGISKLWLG